MGEVETSPVASRAISREARIGQGRDRGGTGSPEAGRLGKLDSSEGHRSANEKTPCFTFCRTPLEEGKSGPTQEYLPSGPCHQRTTIFDEESGALAGKKLVAVGEVLVKMMNDLMFDEFKLHGKPLPTGSGKDHIFPLPWSSSIVQDSPCAPLVVATCRALNHLYGVTAVDEKNVCSAASMRALAFVIKSVEFWNRLDDVFPVMNFDVFFRAKGVDYREEVKVAQRFSWASISPALPPEVGGVSLVDFCTLGTKYYVQNFEEFLVPPEKRFLGRKPTVMVREDDWFDVCKGLIKSRVCGVIPLDEVCHIHGKPMLGGLFGVGKNEFEGDLEVQRLIMNFVPLNENCRPWDADICTLPGIAGLSPFLLEDGEVALISSEDIRCFFYLFRVPSCWFPFLGFNRLVPPQLVPAGLSGRDCVLHATVLPMGFRNSVGIAQHVHRQVIRQGLNKLVPPIGGEGEHRKDRTFTSSQETYRIYLDNFDVLKKTDPETARQIEGDVGLPSLVARQAYAEAQLPRHPKKSVTQATRAEVQGAIVDGVEGIAYPKPQKLGLYIGLALELVRRGCATQREMQVVCGGFVYFCLFRRPLLGSLNAVWNFIEEGKKSPPVVRLPLPRNVVQELLRFCALAPLARMDFRLLCQGRVTASDASSTGGGICVSTGLTSYGAAAANATIRGDVPEEHDFVQVLSVGIYDGAGCLRLACDVLGLPMGGHISVEKSPEARRVVEAAFADSLFLEDVEQVTEDTVREWSGRFSQVGLILLGAGSPCLGESGILSSKKGALKSERARLLHNVLRVRDLLIQHFPWAQVRCLMESVSSLDPKECKTMSQAFGSVPYLVDASGMTLAHRPRYYWVDWELLPMEGVEYDMCRSPEWGDHHSVAVSAAIDPTDYLEPGWHLQEPSQRLPTFTAARPMDSPGRRPAGIKGCSEEELLRWTADHHRFPPYQYRNQNCLVHRSGNLRIPSLIEREVIMGMPANYTVPCLGKSQRTLARYNDVRLSLVGNAWSVPIVAWLIGCLGSLLGLCDRFLPALIVNACKPGGSWELQRLLVRPPIRRSTSVPPAEGVGLVKKLAGLVSMKGEDLLLKSTTDPQIKYQRLRASLPSRLWRWKTIAGWSWQGDPEHINVLELRAVYTSIRWWVSQAHAQSCRMVHLTDSLVCLHCLSRGRSSSRKMRRTMAKLNSYLLACNLHPVWAYVHTSDNPADRPSRRKVKKKWVK